MVLEIAGRKVGSIGFGLLGLTWRSTMPSEDQAFASMRAALASGANLWNGGEFYGTPEHNSLTLLNKYYAKYPDDAAKVVLNVKGALGPGMKPDGRPDAVRKSVEKCLELLGPRGRIDMFECGRRDPDTPVEETVGALAELVREGKIGGVAMCEVNADTIRRAAKVTKIVAVEVELSLWSTEVLTNGIAETCAELNIPIIAYSPMGRGMLTGAITSFDDIPDNDIRKKLPRFQPENFAVNMQLVHQMQAIAARKGCTSAQLAIAWVRALSQRPRVPVIVPIPGAASEERVKENSTEVQLSHAEMAEIDKVLEGAEVKGDRYHAFGMKLVNG